MDKPYDTQCSINCDLVYYNSIFVDYICAILATYPPFTELTPYEVRDVLSEHYEIVNKAKSGDEIPNIEDLVSKFIKNRPVKEEDDEL